MHSGNDHGLDSGAWIKLIKSKYWVKYDYTFILMESFLSLTCVLKSLKNFKIINPILYRPHRKTFYKNRWKFSKNCKCNFYEYSNKKFGLTIKNQVVKNLTTKSANYSRNNQKKKKIAEHHIKCSNFNAL